MCSEKEAGMNSRISECHILLLDEYYLCSASCDSNVGPGSISAFHAVGAASSVDLRRTYLRMYVHILFTVLALHIESECL